MRVAALHLLLPLISLPILAQTQWKPVTEAELALKTPQVQKDADAEALLWEVKVTDEINSGYPQTSRYNYLRLRIFTERGREHAKVELTYRKNQNISGVSGRTVKPDGSIISMKHDAVFDTEVVRGKSLRIRAKSFTLPDVQPGDIIEYQWLESESEAVSNYLRLPLQRDIPVQIVRYYVKPFSSQYLSYSMHAMTFHAEHKSFQPALQGYSSVEYTKMPAYKEEPYMPPEDEVRAWALVFYSDDGIRHPESYWPKVAKQRYALFSHDMKINAEIKKAAADAVAGAGSDSGKVCAIYAWVRKNVKNANSEEVSAEARQAMKENKSSADTIRQGIGTGYDINILFTSLVNAAGLDARIALTGDRSDLFFSPNLDDAYFLRGRLVAVKLDGAWKYYDPATPYLPCGLQLWEQQGTPVLITDGKQPEWSKSQMSLPEESLESHSANLKLAEDGSVSGAFRMKYTGHLAVDERIRLSGKNASERDQYLIDEMKDRFGSPEISDIKWDGIEDAEKPVSVSFNMKIESYVQRTGKRMFVQPTIFQRGDVARFPNSTREHPVYFHYPWSERDEIVIELPPGYELDHPDVPPAIVSGKTASWKVTAEIRNRNTLTYKREFFFGGDGNIMLDPDVYPIAKKLFDAIHTNDEHMFAVKRVSAN